MFKNKNKSTHTFVASLKCWKMLFLLRLILGIWSVSWEVLVAEGAGPGVGELVLGAVREEPAKTEPGGPDMGDIDDGPHCINMRASGNPGDITVVGDGAILGKSRGPLLAVLEKLSPSRTLSSSSLGLSEPDSVCFLRWRIILCLRVKRFWQISHSNGLSPVITIVRIYFKIW